MPLTHDGLDALITRFDGRRVVILGDPVLDCYLYGTTHRISREAPVLIVREDGREHRLGGAANTAANVAALGAHARLVGFVGPDEDGEVLVAAAKRHGIDTAGVARASSGCTVVKTRVLAGGINTTKQQMLRIDREQDGPPSPADAAKLEEHALRALEDAEALIISDYGSGELTACYARIGRAARAAGKVVVVDSRRSLASFRGVTAVTPNEPEAAAALGIELADAASAVRAAVRLTEELDVAATLLTRGREGMIIAERGAEPIAIPAHGGHEAVDVTGAGDTVAATFTVALAAGATVVEAAVLANRAASVVVKTIGTATCSPGELHATLEGLP